MTETPDTSMGKEIRKLRKPVIEKMRRDRINSSIEQLRILVEKEFQKQQLPSKPEKADILELTVSLLRQQLQRASRAMAASRHSSKQGFPTLTRGTVEFIPSRQQTEQSADLQSEASRGHGMCEVRSVPSQASSKQPGQDYSTAADLWRPW